MRFLASLLLLSCALFLVACNDDDRASAPTPTPGVSATDAPGATATRAPGSPTPGTTLPPVDGTVDPLGFGSTEPQTVKPNPDPPSGVSQVTDVRIGAHPELGGWDRIVFEFRDTPPGGEISYVDQAIACGSGEPVALQGQRVLLVQLQPAQAHNDAGQSMVRATQLQGPGGAILEAKQTCDFEADVSWAIGVKGEQRFKVTRLSNPARLVIDIKW